MEIGKVKAKIHELMDIYWKKLPDADTDSTEWTQMQFRYLGQYMGLEAMLDYIEEEEKKGDDPQKGYIELAETWAKEEYPNADDEHREQLGAAYLCGMQKGQNLLMSKLLEDSKVCRVQSSPLNGPIGISAYCCNANCDSFFYRCKNGDNVRVIILPIED